MTHIIMWLNILALFIFISSIPLLITIWLRGLYPWTNTALSYLIVLVFYQLFFTFRYFINVYTGGIPSSLDTVFEIIAVTASAVLIYLLPLLVFHFTGKKPGRRDKLLFLFIAFLLLPLAALSVRYRWNILINSINFTYYLYVAFFSFLGWMGSRKMELSDGESILQSFLFINLIFNLFFIVYLLSGGFLLPGQLPGITVIIPFYIISWAVVFLYKTQKSIRSQKVSKKAVPPDFIRIFGISPRESEVIRELEEGLTNREISEKLYVSPRTIDTHVYKIFHKCDVRNRLELVQLLSRYKSNQ